VHGAGASADGTVHSVGMSASRNWREPRASIRGSVYPDAVSARAGRAERIGGTPVP
jgi:hypothetical protein